MAYIGRDGTIGGREQRTISQKISDFFLGIINIIALFFSAITTPPTALNESTSSYANRNNGSHYRVSGGGGRTLGRGGGAGSNIRGAKNLHGGATAKMGG